MRRDDGGQFWDTIFDVISLGASIAEVFINPADPWAWAGLVGDVVDLVPFVSGVGEATDLVRIYTRVEGFVDIVDDVHDSARALEAAGTIRDGVKIQKATDFTSDAKNVIDSLDHTGGITKSSAAAGRKIHIGYKTNYSDIEGMKKEAVIGRNRID